MRERPRGRFPVPPVSRPDAGDRDLVLLFLVLRQWLSPERARGDGAALSRDRADLRRGQGDGGGAAGAARRAGRARPGQYRLGRQSRDHAALHRSAAGAGEWSAGGGVTCRLRSGRRGLRGSTPPADFEIAVFRKLFPGCRYVRSADVDRDPRGRPARGLSDRARPDQHGRQDPPDRGAWPRPACTTSRSARSSARASCPAGRTPRTWWRGSGRGRASTYTSLWFNANGLERALAFRDKLTLSGRDLADGVGGLHAQEPAPQPRRESRSDAQADRACISRKACRSRRSA